MNQSEIIAETLEWCNEQRALKGKAPLDELPHGRRHDPGSCPCGAATGLIVERTRYGEPEKILDDLAWHDLPHAVRSFVQLFDDGWLPQFDEWAETAERYGGSI